MFLRIANLPDSLNHPDNYRFISTGNKISWKEISSVVLQDFEPQKPLAQGLRVWDSSIEQYVIVVGKVFCIIADNPRSSQVCSTVLASGNKSCRMCDNNNAQDVFGTGVERTKKKSLDIKQLYITTTPSERLKLRLQTGITEEIISNPYFNIPHFDPHKGTPPELLHCVFLGLSKYILKVEFLS
jgi:hypothetical protein